jgi:hypothetical protein
MERNDPMWSGYSGSKWEESNQRAAKAGAPVSDTYTQLSMI